MCFRFLLKFRSCNVELRSYEHVNILDRGLVPKPFGFSQLHPAVNFVPGTTPHCYTATYVFRSVLEAARYRCKQALESIVRPYSKFFGKKGGLTEPNELPLDPPGCCCCMPLLHNHFLVFRQRGVHLHPPYPP